MAHLLAKLLCWHDSQNIWISENIYPHLIIQWAINQSLLSYLRVYDSDAGLMWTRLSLEGLPFHSIVSSWFHLNELFILELSFHCFTSLIVSVFFCFITYCMSHSSLFYLSVAFCLLLYLLLSFQILYERSCKWC